MSKILDRGLSGVAGLMLGLFLPQIYSIFDERYALIEDIKEFESQIEKRLEKLEDEAIFTVN